MTCDKAVKYFLPMLCLSCIDFLAMQFFAMPFLTMAMGSFNIFCEWKSVMETTYEKAQMRRAAKSLSIIIENKDDMAKALVKLLNSALADQGGKEDENERD